MRTVWLGIFVLFGGAFVLMMLAGMLYRR